MTFPKASEEVVRRTSSLRNCDLNDVVGYRWFGTFSDQKSFVVSLPDPNHNISGWSVCLWSWRWNWFLSACQDVSELPVWRRVVNWKWIVFSWPFTLSTVWFSFYVSGGPWMSVNCNHLIRSPNSTLEFCWCQFFVCRDRGNKQFTSLKFPCIRRHQNSSFISQSVLRWRNCVAVSWLWLDCVFSVGFLLLFRRHAVRTKRGKNASILYSIALNVTSINLLNIDIFS